MTAKKTTPKAEAPAAKSTPATSADATEAKPKTTRAKRKSPNWRQLATSPSTAPKATVDAEEAAAPPAAPVEAPATTPVTGKPRVQKKAQTFRLPADCFAIIDRAKELAAENGDKLTNDMIVTEAVRAWGKAWERKHGE